MIASAILWAVVASPAPEASATLPAAPASQAATAPASLPVDADIGEATPPVEPPPATPAARTPLRVAVSSALVGRFASTRCGGALEESPFERMSASFGSTELKKGEREALRLDAGDLLGTATIGRFAVDEDVDALASAISALGVRGVGLGHRDLAAPRARLVSLARALRRLDLSFTLNNLRCSSPAEPLCASVIDADEPPLLLETGSGKVAFVAAVAPSAIAHVDEERRRNIALLPPDESLREATLKARTLGATWVVAVYDPSVQDSLQDAAQVMRSIAAAPAAPDLVLVKDIGDQVRMIVGAAAGTPLVAARPAEAVTVMLEDGTLPEIGVAERTEAAASVKRFAQRLNTKLCGDLEASAPGPVLPKPLDREDFAHLVLDIMREQNRADLGMINDRAISAWASYPVSGPLTPLALLDLVPFEQEVRLVTIRGGRLKAFLDAPGIESFFLRGAAREVGAWRINGRPLDDAQEYRVATTDYVVDTTTAAFADVVAQRHVSLRETLLGWIAQTPPGEPVPEPVDPAERTRWQLIGRLQADLTNVSVINPNPTVFTDPQLSRGQTLSFVGEAEFRAIGSHPAFALENQVRLRYGIVNTRAAGQTTSTTINNVDLVFGRASVIYRRLFRRDPRWFEPRLYVDTLVETELTRPDNRPYHHLMLVPTAGIRFELARPLSLYVGGGLTWEALAREEDLSPVSAPAAAVLVTGWQLLPTRLFTLPQGTLDLETNLDCFIRDLGGQTQFQARLRVRVVIPIYSIFSFTATQDFFVRYVRLLGEGGTYHPQAGFSGDIIIGLQAALGTTRQAFAW